MQQASVAKIICLFTAVAVLSDARKPVIKNRLGSDQNQRIQRLDNNSQQVQRLSRNSFVFIFFVNNRRNRWKINNFT